MSKKFRFMWGGLTVLLIFVLGGCYSDSTAVQNKVTDTKLSADTINNDEFKDLFPLQYNSYYSVTSDTTDTKYGGSVRRPKFDHDKEPLLPALFLGYPFSLDYQEDRGHAFAIEDTGGENRTLRIGNNEKQIGGCLSCKSTAVPELIETMGTAYYSGSFLNDIMPIAEEMNHSPIGCSDCHDPKTMELRITRQYAETAFQEIGIDWKKASKNEMRSLVCAQCHVEYYFEDKGKTVTYPWSEGTTADDMWAYYEKYAESGEYPKDYVSSISGAQIIKMQHPDYETFKQSSHYRAGVSCSDCHMPYNVQNGTKYSTHAWTSPLKTIETSCKTCHSDKTVQELSDSVEIIQDKHIAALHEAEEINTKAHYYVNRMITLGADKEKIAEAQHLIRKAQMYWDYVAAENGAGFHAPQVGMENSKKSTVASMEAIEIATIELVKLGQDLDKLNSEIIETIQRIKDEPDFTKKRDHALNEYFPDVTKLE